MTAHVHRPALAFAVLLLLHDPIITLTGSALFAHALLVAGILWFAADLLLQAIRRRELPWIGGSTTMLALLPISTLGLLYSLLDRGDFSVRIQFLTTFVLAPLIWCAFSQLSTTVRGRLLVGRIILIYVAIEVIVMLLQASYFLLGFGIAPSETYLFMIPGSQFNQNNLACMILALSVFYNAVSGDWPRWQRVTLNLLVVAILVITFSRLAILLYVADRIRSLSLRRFGTVLGLLAVLVGAGLLIANIDYTGNDTIDASLYKAKSLATIAEIGFETDTSTSSRSESYFNFVDKLGVLGFGSAEILNYGRYTWDALFSDETLYINPHSMVVELGYWMGWPGMISLALFLTAFLRTSQGSAFQRGFILLAVLLTSSIPSSAIPLPTLWVGMLLLAMLGEYRPRPATGLPATPST
jgi:hypothetical protein